MKALSDPYQQQREEMVRQQIELRGVRDSRVLEAMRTIPRHVFVPESEREAAYMDNPLPIGEGQTISQPFMVAVMSELLELKGSEKVLEIGTGSGYQTAVLSQLAKEIFSVERLPQLAETARARLEGLGVSNVNFRLGDGNQGWPECAPFDAILVAAAAMAIPPALLTQLAEGGRMVIPVGSPGGQILQLWRRKNGELSHENRLSVAFVPLISSGDDYPVPN